MLSPERRAKLLAVIGGEAGKEASPPDSSVLALPLVGSKKKTRRRWQPWLWAAAACLPLAVVVKLATIRSYDRRPELPSPSASLMELPLQEGSELAKEKAAATKESEEKDAVQLSAFEVAPKPSIAARIKQAFTTAPVSQNREGADADAAGKNNPATMQVQGVMDAAIRTSVDEVTMARSRSARAENLARDTNRRQTLNGGGRADASTSGALVQSGEARFGGGRGGGGASGVVGGAAGKAINGNIQLVAGQGGTTWNYAGQSSALAPARPAPENGIVIPGNRDFSSFSGARLSATTDKSSIGDGLAPNFAARATSSTDSTATTGGFIAPTNGVTYGYAGNTGTTLVNGGAPAFADQKQLFDLSTIQAAAAPSSFSRVDQSAARDQSSFIGGSTLNLGASAPPATDLRTLGAVSITLAEKKDSGTSGFVFGANGGAGAKPSEETVQLSPFMVTSDTKGYYAANTLAGTRLNSKLEDLASSISVVTRQQMNDMASVNNTGSFLSEAQALPAPASPTASAPTAPAKVQIARKTAAVEVDLPVDHAASIPAVDESLRAEVAANTQPVSTFSLHVSDVSFRLTKAALDRGARPDPAAIRPEEFYNAFDYGDPSPASGEPVSCRVEQSAHPFLQQRNLVRIAMKVPATGRGAGQPLRLTVLLDTSGSMEREDRAASVRKAMEVLASLLGPDDRVTLIGFARQPRLLADRVPGDQAAKLVEIIGRTPAEGGTNLEEALKLAGEHARAQFTAGAQNRIVVLTDGAANLGNDDPVQLSAQIVTLRQQGIAFDACGIGADGLDDTILEALTRKGDGRYYVINSPAEADAGFAHELAGAFRPAAQNVKVQVRFNPARVRAYRLIGFEQHRLREEDFHNDRVDAAELAAEEAAVALYQVEVLPEGDGELGDVFVRFHNTATGEMVERSWTLAYAPQAPAFDRATPSIQLAGIAALVAERLRGGALAAQIRLGDLAPVVNTLRGHYAHEAHVQELVTMFTQTRRLTGE